MKTGEQMKDYATVFPLEKSQNNFKVILVKTNAPGCIFAPDEQPKLMFQIQNLTDQPIKTQATFELLAYGTRGIPGDIWLPDDDDDYQKFCKYIAVEYGWSKGPVIGLMLWNESWEGRSISGWQADMICYRELHKRMEIAAHEARKEAGVDVLVGGCDSSSNTWDKLFADGSDEFLPYLDFCSIHYQGMSSPSLYKKWINRKAGNGRVLIWDTESWVANTDDRFAGVVATNRAAGYDRSMGCLVAMFPHGVIIMVDLKALFILRRSMFSLEPTDLKTRLPCSKSSMKNPEA